MYRKEPKKVISFVDFHLPIDSRLNEKNRWVLLAGLIPWDEFEDEYAKNFSSNDMGAPAKPFRMALSAEIIKRKLDITDEEVVQQISENPYLQFFIGMERYSNEAPFDPSMMTHFRERLPLDMVNRVNERVIENENKKKEPKEIAPNGEGENKNKGKLLLDASCVPQDIRYPTDLSLLNEAREKTEGIIDRLHEVNGKKGKKPKTHRKKARKEYVKIVKQRNKSKKELRRGIKKQLGYVRRNLKIIGKLAEIIGNMIKSMFGKQNFNENQELLSQLEEDLGYMVLSKREQKNLEVCREVFNQQEQMYKKKENRVDDRIVSISQPHIRPIKRGKAGAQTEFGSKLLISVVDGNVRIEKLAWDNFNEGKELIGSIDAYKKRYGYYPESVHVDKIFLTKDNRKYCKDHLIRISGPPLGRPSNDEEKNKETRKLEAQDGRDRIPVEGKFGNCKRKYGLNRIFAKKKDTSECEIAVGILLLNLDKYLRGILSANADDSRINGVHSNRRSKAISSQIKAA